MAANRASAHQEVPATGRAGGVDGCPGGWIAAIDEPGGVRLELVEDAHTLLALRVEVLAIDIPIGLPSSYVPGGRRCDHGARGLLGRPRSSSVFSAPPRPSLALGGFDAPGRRELGLTLQAWNIVPKVAAIDDIVAPQRQWLAGRQDAPELPLIAEVHPELSFYELNGGRAVEAPKRRAAGRRERAELLVPFFPVATLLDGRAGGAGVDDVLDALVALWTARRLLDGIAERVPVAEPELDERGLRMEIWR